MSIVRAILVAVPLLSLTLSAAAQYPAPIQNLGLNDFQWELINNDSTTGVAEYDSAAKTLFVWPNDSCWCAPELIWETVAPHDGTVSVIAGMTSLDGWDEVRYYVDGSPTQITGTYGDYDVLFDVSEGQSFGLGAWGDGCCHISESPSVTFHTFEFLYTVDTPFVTVGEPLDVRLQGDFVFEPADSGDLDLVGDVDGDGVDDFAWSGAEHGTVAEDVMVISGATHEVLWAHNSGEQPFVSALGDLDLDGVPDVVTGRKTVLSVWSGADGSSITNLFAANLGLPIFFHADAAGDRDLDGLPDLWTRHPAELGLVSGAGSLIDLVVLSPVDSLLAATEPLTRLGDVDADGVDDVAAGFPSDDSSASSVYVVSGATREVIWAHTVPHLGAFGWSLADAGDMDADGVTDLVVGEPQVGPEGTGRAHAFSGATGATLYEFTGQLHDGLGADVSGAGDVNADGHADVLLGGKAPFWANERIELRSGLDGALLHEVNLAPGYDLGHVVLGDLDGDLDGQPEFVVAALALGETESRLLFFDDLHLPYGQATLEGVGSLLPGSTWELRYRSGPPFGSAFLVLGVDTLNAPFKGGTMIPTVDVLLAGLPLDDRGDLTLAGIWPAGIPSGLELAWQAWTPDVHGPAGFGSTNGVLFLVP